MTDILSAISGHFSKSLILGTFLPAVLFIILGTFFVLPLFPDGWWLWEQISAGQTRGVLLMSFVTIVLTGLLYNLNTPIIRFYEGYTWQRSLIGKSRTRHYQRRLREAEELEARLRDVDKVLDRTPRNKPTSRGIASPPAGVGDGSPPASAEDLTREDAAKRSEKIVSLLDQTGRLILREFPISTESVLPTRLGNVIRSFEHYPRRQYEMAAITLWPRLVAKIDKDYAAQIDSAKMNVDFALNCSLLAFFLSLLMLFVGLWHPVVLSAPRLWVPWLLKIALFASLSWAFYHSSIGRASEWGEMVRGAFDLYRGDLLKQLGVRRVPASLEEERGLWGLISRQLIYGDRPQAETLPEYEARPCFARGTPVTLDLRVTRGVTPEPNGLITVTVRVRNHDRQGCAAANIVLTDTLPPGFDYVWGSAKLGTTLPAEVDSPASGSPPLAVFKWEEARMTGANPYRFYITKLNAQEEVVVQYASARRKE